MLNFNNHNRKFINFQYVYPVLSRRAQGLSIGINLNVNNACNWRCVYCQVDGLIRGTPTDIDLTILEYELDCILQEIFYNNFLIGHIDDKKLQRFNDIALSGNGEPTLSNQFFDVITIIAKLRTKYNYEDQLKNVKTILITNGSQMSKLNVQHGLKLLAQHNGEVWFKIDSGNIKGIKQINQIHLSLSSIKQQLLLSCSLCVTYVQSCFFKISNNDPSNDDIHDYINFIKQVNEQIAGVMIYTVARPSMLDEGAHVTPVSKEFLQNINQLVSVIVD